MKVKEIMTPEPACCTPNDPIERAARLMVDHDCGEIPVVESVNSCRPVGVITDRDIACRTVAKGLNPLQMTVSECMSTPLIAVNEDDDIYDCYALMEKHQVRRLPVIDENGVCVGIVALADIARKAPKSDSGEVLKDVSAASPTASSVGA